MNILFLTARLPYPLYKGDKLRAYYQIKHLSKRHDVYLLSFIESEEEYQYIDELKQYCRDVCVVLLKPLQSYWNVIANLFSSIPAQTAYYYSKDMLKAANEIIGSGKIDLVHVQLFRMAPYADKQNIPKVIDLQDSFSLGIKRLIGSGITWRHPVSFLEYIKVRTYERKVVSRYDRALIISEVDKASLMNGSNVEVVPNGVNLCGPRAPDHDTRRGVPKRLIFTGNMAYYPNVDAVRYICSSIWPLLKERYGALQLFIVGIDPVRAVRKLQTEDITVTGYVQDMRATLEKADIYLAPFRMGRGVQNKILEALAAGLPVVTTDIGNEGIDAENGKSIIVENTVEGLVDAIGTLIENPAYYRTIVGGGLEFVRRNFAWEKVIDQLDHTYMSVMRSKRPGGDLKDECPPGAAAIV